MGQFQQNFLIGNKLRWNLVRILSNFWTNFLANSIKFNENVAQIIFWTKDERILNKFFQNLRKMLKKFRKKYIEELKNFDLKLGNSRTNFQKKFKRNVRPSIYTLVDKSPIFSVDCCGTNPTWSGTFCHTSTSATCLWTIAELCL